MTGKHIINYNDFDEARYNDIDYIDEIIESEKKKNYLPISECQDKYYNNNQTKYIKQYQYYVENKIGAYATALANNQNIQDETKRNIKKQEIIDCLTKQSPFNSTMDYSSSPLSKSIVRYHVKQIVDSSTKFLALDTKTDVNRDQEILDEFMYSVAWSNIFSNMLTMSVSTGLGVLELYFDEKKDLMCDSIDPTTCFFVMKGNKVLYAYRKFNINAKDNNTQHIIYTETERFIYKNKELEEKEAFIHGFDSVPVCPFVFQEEGFSLFEDCIKDIYLYDILCWIQQFQAIDPNNLLLTGAVNNSSQLGMVPTTQNVGMEWITKPSSDWVELMKHVMFRCCQNIMQSTNYIMPEFKEQLKITATQVNSTNAPSQASILATANQLESSMKYLMELLKQGLLIKGTPIEDILFNPKVQEPKNIKEMLDVLSNENLAPETRASIVYDDDKQRDEYINFTKDWELLKQAGYSTEPLETMEEEKTEEIIDEDV